MPKTILNKRGQMKTFESIAVLIILVFIFGIGLRFYAQTQIDELERAEIQFQSLDILKNLVTITTMEEFSCSRLGIRQSSCIDFYKAKAASDFADRTTYKNQFISLFGDAKINLTMIYPEEGAESIIIYENNPQAYIESETYILPVTVYRLSQDGFEDDMYYYGVIQVEKYLS